MYHPTRGGTRGGAAEFSWETVKASKDREFYLGNSVAAPTGRWQNGRDINWYNKDAGSTSASGQADEQRRAELRAIKQAEEEALYAKLGRKPPSAGLGESSLGQHLAAGSTSYVPDKSTGANTAPIDEAKSRAWKAGTEDVTDEDRAFARKLAKEQVKNDLKRQRREEKELVRAERRQRRTENPDDRRHSHHDEHRSRSHDRRRHRHDEHSSSSHHRQHHDHELRSERLETQQDPRDRDERRHRVSSRVHPREEHQRARRDIRSRSRSQSPGRTRRRASHARPRSRSRSPTRSHRHSPRRDQMDYR